MRNKYPYVSGDGDDYLGLDREELRILVRERDKEIDKLRAEILAARRNGSTPEAFWLPDAEGNVG